MCRVLPVSHFRIQVDRFSFKSYIVLFLMKAFILLCFLRYLLHTLDQFVEEDYSLVYFHYGLNSKNKPPLSWLWQAYKAFDRKYKKNLKALYLVHPTNFIKVVWQIFKPAIRLVLFCIVWLIVGPLNQNEALFKTNKLIFLFLNFFSVNNWFFPSLPLVKVA